MLGIQKALRSGNPPEDLRKSSGLIAKNVAGDEGMEQVSCWSTSVPMTYIRGVWTLLSVEQLFLHHFLVMLLLKLMICCFLKSEEQVRGHWDSEAHWECRLPRERWCRSAASLNVHFRVAILPSRTTVSNHFSVMLNLMIWWVLASCWCYSNFCYELKGIFSRSVLNDRQIA